MNTLKQGINIEIVDNGLKAYVTFDLSEDDLKTDNRSNLMKALDEKLKENGIVFGINKKSLNEEISNYNSYIIAEGTLPQNGTDSIIKMIEIKEEKPKIGKDDKADFYDLKLINKVNTGDWIGEKILAKDGVIGTYVTDEKVKPNIIKGIDLPLNYDKNSIQEVILDDKITLHAMFDGAVSFANGKLTVLKNLIIDEVNLKTGCIKFDGHLTIKGTICDGFSVEATNDIEINGELGLGNVKEIISTKGSIFIKGGIASNGNAIINAAKNVFAKFANNCIITCNGAAHIGFYCINSTVYANEVIIDSPTGHIIGGNVKAEIRIIAPIIGSESEKRTVIEVMGFDKEALKITLENTLKHISELKIEQQKLKQILSSFNTKGANKSIKSFEFIQSSKKMIFVIEEIKEFEEKRNSIAGYMRVKGDCEICITKKIFPKSVLILKGIRVEISSSSLAKSYYIQGGQLKET